MPYITQQFGGEAHAGTSPPEVWSGSPPQSPDFPELHCHQETAPAPEIQNFRKSHADICFLLISLGDRQSGSNDQLCLQHEAEWPLCLPPKTEQLESMREGNSRPSECPGWESGGKSGGCPQSPKTCSFALPNGQSRGYFCSGADSPCLDKHGFSQSPNKAA